MSAPLLQTRDLQLAFGAVVVADHIDFSLSEGERLAVIGQNGAGKTTTMRMLTIRTQANRSTRPRTVRVAATILERQRFRSPPTRSSSTSNSREATESDSCGRS